MQSEASTHISSPIQPMRVGEILDRSLQLAKNLFSQLFVVYALLSLPTALADSKLFGNVFVVLLLKFLGIILACFAHPAVLRMIAAQWRGQSLSFRKALSTISVGLVLRGIMLTFRISTISALYALLFIIPGIVYGVNRILSLFIFYIEDTTAAEAVARSKFLMTQKGYFSADGPWTRVGGLTLVTMVAGIVVAIIFGTGGIVLLAGMGPASILVKLILLLVGGIVTALIGLFSSAVMIGFYYDLCARYEGKDLEAIMDSGTRAL